MSSKEKQGNDSFRLNIDKLVKTKIVCTLGPASDKKETLEKMIRSGMDIVRLNFSHGDHKEHEELFNMVRELSKKYDEQISVICDIQGPKIRVGKIDGSFEVHRGDIIRVTSESIVGTKERIQIKYPTMLKDLKEGDIIFINDGIIKLIVIKKEEKDLVCKVEAGGSISSHKGCNIPSGNISMDVLTEKDKKDLQFIVKLNPEFVAASFIGSANDVEKIRKYIADLGNNEIKIISKIERPIALKNIDAIIKSSDAIMVARGDLGVEIPPYQVPSAQKIIVKKCNKEGRPVIVATQMLESMTTQSRPTRAEVNDVFNAVLDGADAVMLSGESSIGQYPVESVKMMDEIITEAEKHMPKRHPNEYNSSSQGLTETIGHSVHTLVSQFEILHFTGKILVIADSGYTAKMVSKYRPPMDIIAITNNIRVCHELNLVWGVRSVLAPECMGDSLEERTLKAIKTALNLNLINLNDHVIVVSRSAFGKHTGSFSGVYNVKKVIEHK